MRNQRTIAKSISVAGRDHHDDRPVSATLEPAEAGTGVVFVRADLEPPREVRAIPRNATDVGLANHPGGEVDVAGVETLLAVTFAVGVDNLRVVVDAAALPELEGGPAAWLAAIDDAGVVEQARPRRMFGLDRPLDAGGGLARIAALPEKRGLRISYTHFDPDDPAAAAHVSLAADELRESMVGSPTSATEGVLDVLAALALLEADLGAHVVATGTGYRAALELVRAIDARLAELTAAGEIQSDTGLTVKQILEIIPHRYPFLFLDRVLSMDEERAVAIKNVTFNEPHFQGHWPGEPVFPGVLQVEALGQLGGVWLSRRLEHTGRCLLLSIDNIKFRRPVTPGDQLRLECEAVSVRRRTAKIAGRGLVDGEVTVEAQLTFMTM